MLACNFEESLAFFAAQLKTEIPKEIDPEGVDLELDNLSVSIMPSILGKGIIIEINLGLLLQPIPPLRLKELINSNFLGINTGGCSLYLDDEGVGLSLKAVTTATTTPQENWEWLHRLLHMATEWMNLLSNWKEFIPLMPPLEQQRHEGVEGKA